MNKSFFKREVIVWVALLIPNIYMAVVWNQLPEQLPIHWNIQGEADQYAPKYTLPIIHLGVYLLFLIIPMIDPRKKNYEIFLKTYFKLRLVLVLFFGMINALVFTNELGYPIDLARGIIISVLVLFVLLGNYLQNVRPNWFIGIRTPWTLENEDIWRKTHFLASKLFFWGGLIMLILSFILAQQILFPVVFGGIIALSLAPVAYSFILYQKV